MIASAAEGFPYDAHCPIGRGSLVCSPNLFRFGKMVKTLFDVTTLQNSKEASEVIEGKSSRMRLGR